MLQAGGWHQLKRGVQCPPHFDIIIFRVDVNFGHKQLVSSVELIKGMKFYLDC